MDQLREIPTDPGPPRRRALDRLGVLIAWVVIVAACGFMIVENARPAAVAPDPADDDAVGLIVMRLQGQVLVATRSPLAQAEMLNVGSVPQRQRYVVLAGDLGGAAAGGAARAELDRALDECGIELAADQAEVQRVLAELFPQRPDPDVSPWDRVARLSADDRALLRDALGWWGGLALAPPDPPEGDEQAAAEREAAMAPAQRVMLVFTGVVAGLLGLGGLGFVGLVGVGTLVVLRLLRAGLPASASRHGVYAETFAVWIVLFGLLQAGAARVAPHVPDLGLLVVAGVFFASLLALAWPVVRGIPWRDVRRDAGLTLGRVSALEPALGVAGYAMALPLLAVGVAGTFVLLQVQLAASGPADPCAFGPSGGPAHPIIGHLGGPAIWPKIQVLVLAAIAAPVVEEIMFRGVLYRHLRELSRSAGVLTSIAFSVILSSVLFAAIHPQGWVAIPVLGSLGAAFALMREWRDSVVPSIVMHGVSNGLVMTLLIVLV